MAASFSAASLFAIREEEDQNQMKQQHSSTPPSSSTTLPAPAPPQKKRKNHQPGTPYPDAEVIALSPKTLMATNRFVCEVCNKGFQREQNLQLHRRGHNLPWKLKQKGNNKDQQPPKRKVYLCPEPTCVHHEPSRALGDLTGVKKHFSRKHGEKKWKCDKCSKKYAVQSDWKAHSKTCGTREYRCDCGTLFSRRDSFITHRAFCDALAHESGARPPPPPPNHLNSAISISSQLYNGNGNMSFAALSEIDQNDNNMLRFGNTRTGQFNHILSPPQQVTLQTPSLFNIPAEPNQNQNQNFNLPFLPIRGTNTNTNSNINLLFSENFTNEEGSIFFPEGPLYDHSPISPHMSATALLQKAAQMGVSSSSNSCNSNNNTASSSLLRSFGGMTKSDHRAVLVSANNGNTNNMQELIMNSFAAGFEEACEYNNNNNNHDGMDHHRGDPKVETMMSIGGGSDGFTRDFLGVGEIVRNMSGGVSQREQQQQQQQRGFNLEAEKNINAAPLTGQSFGGGGNFQ